MNPERLARIRLMLSLRQPDLTVCLEQVNKAHNVAAIMRTCDAVGIHEIHAVWPEELRENNRAAKGSHNWVKLHRHDTTAQAISALKQQNMQILATNLSSRAVDFREIDYTRPTAILFGAEKYGISAEALALADQDIIIPMVGMAQSLNVSVASALILYEAQRQRQQAGFYKRGCLLPDDEQQRLLFEGGYPRLAAFCRSKSLAYPAIGEQGEILANEEWWLKLQLNPALWNEEHIPVTSEQPFT
ncbi:MAG: tRNA (guanosine(18)-2'-O)-methyltransferase TrmH [Tolumonas sp.]